MVVVQLPPMLCVRFLSKFIADLLKKLGVGSSALSPDELEDIGMGKLMQGADKTKKVSRAEIMKKLSA